MIARMPQSIALTASTTQRLFLSARLGLVSVPAPEGALPQLVEIEPGFEPEQARDLIRSLGRDLGMALLTPRTDSFPEAEPAGEAVSFPDEAVRKTLEGLDAVWIKDGEVVTAFVLETAPGLWVGIRKLADLLALHPKLKIPLYAVSLPSLRAGLLEELHRPVYQLLKTPLPEAVRLLDWPRLQSEVKELGERVRYLKPEFLEGISDVSELPAAP